jgi:hypothetical protein
VGMDPLTLGLIGSAVIGAGGSYLSSKEQSKASKAAAGSIYQPQYLGGIDTATATAIQNIMGGRLDPKYTQYADQMLQQAQGVGAPNAAYQQYLDQYLRGAFNPQLDPAYNQMIQGVRGATSARGLTTSPYGAGLEGLAAQQWGMSERDRQAAALQNYMAGQGSLQGLGSNALQAALGLQQAKQQWPAAGASMGLQYMGLGATAGGQMSALQQQIGQQNAAPWAALGQAGAGLAGDLLRYKLMPPATTTTGSG